MRAISHLPMRQIRRLSLAALVCLASAVFSQPAAAHETSCASLSGQRLALDPVTMVDIENAVAVPAKTDLPAHCEISGYITPQVGFVIRLPDTGWTGRYLQQGCRGACGLMHLDTANDALARGYAVATTDMGHKGASSLSAIWALNNPPAELDFAHRATHVTALAVKKIVQLFYGKDPSYSYFRGCGTGGRQGLMEAQLHPDDFQGIVSAGGAVIDFSRLSLYGLPWNIRANRSASGAQILDEADIRLVHNAVLKKCDAIDGLKDGLIQAPGMCKFQPEMLRCKGKNAKSCLSAEKVAAVNRYYTGPKSAGGQQLYSGFPKGSEFSWPDAFFGTDAKYTPLTEEFLRYLVFKDDPAPDYSINDVDLDAPLSLDLTRHDEMAAIDTDLSAFRAAGGKLLIAHGWNEPAMPAGHTIKYYENVKSAAGPGEDVDEFFRLFMVPGEYHCAGGVPRDLHFDFLSAIENWVENGRAPGKLVGHTLKTEPVYPVQARFPLMQDQITGRVPLLPYPKWPKYTGKGDPNDPANFVAGNMR